MKQSEAEWLETWLDSWDGKYGLNLLTNTAKSKRLLAALRRRGWRAPVRKSRTKKGR